MRNRIRMGATARRRLTLAAASTVLAFGAIVLSRAQGAHAEPPGVEEPVLGVSATQQGHTRVTVGTPELTGFVALTQGAVLAHGTRELFAELRVEARQVDGQARRRPVAIAVVLDTSGSMSGDKIEQARRSVLALAARMHPEDRLAVITYDMGARVVQPLASIGLVRETLAGRVQSIAAGGGTNIPSGLALGAIALSDAPPSMIRRLVLVSDGLDGSGRALSDVGREVGVRANAGTTTSTLGVGTDYDERWLTTMADAGRGNYEFLATGSALATFLTREVEQASATVADGTTLDLALPAGWRVVDVYGATFDGGSIPLGSLFAGERRRVTIRFEVAAGAPGAEPSLGLGLRYRAAGGESSRNLDLGRLSISIVDQPEDVASSRDITLHAEAVAQRVEAVQAQAVVAWRAGRAEEARRLTQDNLAILEQWRQQAPAARAMLNPRIQATEADLDNFERTEAASPAGRAYGLRSNARRRSVMGAF